MESYHSRKLGEVGINTSFLQDNRSFSKKGVLRGLHFQKPPYEQGKLISVLQGEVLDVVVDIRESSSTFGEYYSCILNDEKHNILYVPEGMAHGFLALKDSLFVYKCTSYYHKQSEAGIVWNDVDLAIDWGESQPILSDKDAVLPTFKEVMEKL
jgi:dTDP-4-dehydrorhamnose 3,5-epimerase